MKTKTPLKTPVRKSTFLDALIKEIPSFLAPKPTKVRQLPRRKRKALEKWNDAVFNEPTGHAKGFEPKLAAIAREVVESHTPGIKWDYPELPVTVTSDLLPGYSSPLDNQKRLISELAKSAVEGLADQAQIELEDKLLAILPALIAKFQPALVKRALGNIDTTIVDYILDKQIFEKQQTIADLEKQTQTLQQWKQTTKSE